MRQRVRSLKLTRAIEARISIDTAIYICNVYIDHQYCAVKTAHRADDLSDGDLSNTPKPLDHDEAAALIVAIAKAGDKAAFARLFDLFAPLIKGYLRRGGCAAAEAEELAQETLLTVWRKAHQYDAARASAATWIYTIARNLRVDAMRRTPLEGAASPQPDIDDSPSPYDLVAGGDATARLQAALAGLPAEQAEVIQAAYVEHRAHAEIAEKLGLPLGTVKSRLRLALRRLRAELEITP